MFLTQFIIRMYHLLMHYLAFQLTSGGIDLYPADETKVKLDGHVIVRVTETDWRGKVVNREITYGYVFEDRYYIHKSPGMRCIALWSYLNEEYPGYRPIIMIENGRFYTPFAQRQGVFPTLSQPGLSYGSH